MKIPTVDKNDQIIAYKERDEINYAIDIFRTASLWIMNSKGEILLAQRKENKKVDPGKWAEAVGGTVEEEWYTTIVDLPAEAFTIQPEEVERVAWVAREQLIKELREAPSKYIAAMPEIVALFP